MVSDSWLESKSSYFAGRGQLPKDRLFFLRGLEGQRGRVDAMPQTRGGGTVSEYMAQVSIAAGAEHLYSSHTVAIVALSGHVAQVDGSVKAGPARARLEFGRRAVKGQIAAYAVVGACFFVVPILSGEGSLGACLARYAVLLLRELRFPLSVRFFDFFALISGCYELLQSIMATRASLSASLSDQEQSRSNEG